VKIVSTSDLTAAVYFVRTIFVCYACIYAFHALPQRSERLICKNYIIIIIIISCHRFSLFPGTSPLEPVVNPTTQASSLSL
jgi:hypothetical protein